MQDKGHIVKGQLHGECSPEEGCGEKYEVGNTGQIVELERDEAVIIPDAFDDKCFGSRFCKKPDIYEINGTIAQIAGVINQLGGGVNFAKGAKVIKNGRKMSNPNQSNRDSRRNPPKLQAGSVVINRTNMLNPEVMTFTGTLYQIASDINSHEGNGVSLIKPNSDQPEPDNSDFAKGGTISRRNTILKKIETDQLINAGHVKIGFRKEWLDGAIILGRQRNIILPNQEEHEAYFAIVELDSILPSHHPKSFASTEGYPTSENGRNINDRNYSGDKVFQYKVQNVAQQLRPDLIISTGVDSEGTPIVTIDGVVISGNNRTMSLKLAQTDFPEMIQNYQDTLKHELMYEGYGITDHPKEIISKFKAPVLVRIDLDFQSYTTEEMNKYNQNSKKSERPLDQAIRISQQLEENLKCKEALITLVSEQETVTKINESRDSILRLRKILLDCGLMTDNELGKYFTDNELSADGKLLYQSLLLSLVLNPKALEISQKDGVRKSVRSIINAVIPIIKNQDLKIGNITEDINDAVLIQNKVVSSKIVDLFMYLKNQEIFDDSPEMSFRALVINVWIVLGGNQFKLKLLEYNKVMANNQEENMFGEPEKPSIIFYDAFVKTLPTKERIAILSYFKEMKMALEIEKEIHRISTTINDPQTAQNTINQLIIARNFVI